MPRTAGLDGLDELLDRQLAVASRHQLLDLGMKGHAMQYRARREGPWQTLPDVCLTVSGCPVVRRRRWRRCFTAGPEASSPDQPP